MTRLAPSNSHSGVRRRWLAALLAGLTLATTGVAQTLPDEPIPFDTLRGAFPDVDVIAVGATACYALDTLLANTPERRARGLMFVESMPENAGMLFVHRRNQRLSIWMKNTLIPLDILFADADGIIMNVAYGVPLTLTSMRSKRAARYVLELNAGRAEALGLGAGAQLIVFAG